MKMLLAPCAGLALLLFSVAGQATTIEANYSVTANTSDPGLKIETATPDPAFFSYTLAEGDQVTFDLFDIWTEEGSVNHDDTDSKSILVNFDFILPPAIPGENIEGTTVGGSFFLGLAQWGEVTWNDPAVIDFGADGHFTIALSNETFNEGVFGLQEGEGHGATIKATLTLNKDATAVPEPGTLALFGLGLLGLGFTVRRQRSRG